MELWYINGMTCNIFSPCYGSFCLTFYVTIWYHNFIIHEHFFRSFLCGMMLLSEWTYSTKTLCLAKDDLATGCKTKWVNQNCCRLFYSSDLAIISLHAGMDIVDINEKVFIAILIKLFGMLSAFYITNMYREF